MRHLCIKSFKGALREKLKPVRLHYRQTQSLKSFTQAIFSLMAPFRSQMRPPQILNSAVNQPCSRLRVSGRSAVQLSLTAASLQFFFTSSSGLADEVFFVERFWPEKCSIQQADTVLRRISCALDSALPHLKKNKINRRQKCWPRVNQGRARGVGVGGGVGAIRTDLRSHSVVKIDQLVSGDASCCWSVEATGSTCIANACVGPLQTHSHHYVVVLFGFERPSPQKRRLQLCQNLAGNLAKSFWQMISTQVSSEQRFVCLHNETNWSRGCPAPVWFLGPLPFSGLELS